MAINFSFLEAFILLIGAQGGHLVPSSPFQVEYHNDNHFQMFDMGVLLNRLDHLEAKVEQHEVKINRQQIEIDQLKKKNSDLEERNNQLVLAGAKEDGVASRSSLTPRTCLQLKTTYPTSSSGNYLIDPDGQNGGDPPIEVYCDMATLTTSIYHDTENKTDVTKCTDPGCYTKSIKYAATMRQLAMLADISASCRQYFKFESIGVPLEYNKTQYGYWYDRNNNKQIFWAGPVTSQHTCQCGINNNCVNRTHKCNADSLSNTTIADEGNITAKNVLPVTRLNFGRTSLTGVKASYTLGRFECTGQATISTKPTNCLDLFKMGHTLNGFYDVDGGNNQISSVYCDFTKSSTETGYEIRYGPAVVSSKPTSCRDLFKMGHTLSGFYDVKGGNNQISAIYCDFSKSSTETGYETRYGFVDVKSSPVHFFVTRTSSWSKKGTMPFEKEYLNLGGGMNLASGVFTAPKAGIYAFAFKGIGYGKDGRGSVLLQRNGADVACGTSYIVGVTSSLTESTVSVHGTLKLNKGDAITIRHNIGTIHSASNSWTQFTGSLIEEDLVIS